MQAEVISIQVGGPREVSWRGRTVRTGIYKDPVRGPVRVGATHLEGDGQADLTVHGGVDKAVYAYPAEHYALWESELSEPELAWGSFGENLTLRGLLERDVYIGDRLRVGSAVLRVTQPRVPCYKLGIRLGSPDVVKRFQRSGRSGFYLAVVEQGLVAAGDAVLVLERAAHSLSVHEVWSLTGPQSLDPALLERASELPGLPENWRQDFRERRQKLRRST